MSSSVFFRFKSQKEPSRVTFDGTGISVFELKRDIINLSRLGDGTDFELIITAEGTNEVYDDDTTIVPRSSTVIARRTPAAKPGRGGAARYVSGKAPVNAKNNHRAEAPSARSNGLPGTKTSAPTADFSELETEEERIKAMFDLSAGQWKEQQQEMANATPVYRGGQPRGRPVNVPDHPPPPGYVCYRCGKKGHYIQVCPENDNKALDGRPKIKRAAGIPTTMLRKIEEPTAFSSDGTIDESKRPSGAMLDANGNWVRAEPDKASWDQFQTRAKVSVAAQQAKAKESKDLQDRGLECSIDKQMFVEPTKTPCCATVFCKDCINNSLLENDLQCPKCGKDVLLDDLIPDEDAQSKIHAFKVEKENASKSKDGGSGPIKQEDLNKGTDQTLGHSPKGKEERRSPVLAPNGVATQDILQVVKNSKENAGSIDGSEPSIELKATSASPSSTAPNKKRPADVALSGNRKAPNPSGGYDAVNSSSKGSKKDQSASLPSASSVQGYNPTTLANLSEQMTAFNSFMGMGMSMPMSMPPLMGMTPGMMNSQMPNFPFATDMSAWTNMQSMGLHTNNGLYGAQFAPNMLPSFGFNQPNTQMPFNPAVNDTNGMNRMNGTQSGNKNPNGRTPGAPQPFKNQQRTSFSNGPSNNNEDSPYFRQPVNPNRHQGRRNGNRPASYREI